MPTGFGKIKLFTLLGVTVYLDWFMWLLIGVALYWSEFASRPDFDSIAELIGLNLCLFAIVLTHEFGHALACRSVGGKADRIVLWPLGGIAYVSPPPRPGAVLWCIAAGPLVNVALVPVTLLLYYACSLAHAAAAANFAWIVVAINLVLLIFNMLPIYPLDGGRILQSLIWFVVGRAWSLIISGVIGILGAAGFALFALAVGQPWYAALAAFLGYMALRGLRYGMARATRQFHAPPCPAALPRVPRKSPGGPLLALFLRKCLRRVCLFRLLPALRTGLSHDRLPALRHFEPAGRMVRARPPGSRAAARPVRAGHRPPAGFLGALGWTDVDGRRPAPQRKTRSRHAGGTLRPLEVAAPSKAA